MSSTLLEVTRSAHEDVERLERLVVRDLQREPASNRVRLFQNHRVRNMIDTIISTTDKLIEIYEDKDNARKDEISVLGGQTASGGIDVFSAFYDRLKENLYDANVRKVVVMGLAPICCTPHYLWQHNSKNGECVDEINNLVLEFNFAFRFMVYELNRELSDAKIVFCDAFKGSMDILTNRHLYGFETTIYACCGLGKYGGLIMCLMPEMACSNGSNHVWWDKFHPTGAVNAILADNVWSGVHTNMCYPMNLQDMIG